MVHTCGIEPVRLSGDHSDGAKAKTSTTKEGDAVTSQRSRPSNMYCILF